MLNSLRSIAAAILVITTAFTAFSADDITESISAGVRLSIGVTSDGNPAPTFQWLKDGSPIAGATGVSYVIEKLDPGHAGTYTAIATNSQGSATSNKYILDVLYAPTAPTIKSSFGNVTVYKQSAVLLAVVAEGEALKYHWQKGTSLINGATGPSYLIPKVNPSHAGTYAVTVSNGGGSVTASGRVTVR